ncbi:hypothetical protein HYT51_00330 [Candidatus Woesearchaeota archaeon]|nr:hypothetical protein [Candidatus Woesearchaeota archaeon]
MENVQHLKDKTTYAIACSSAKILGPKSITIGASSYIGYDDDFIFFYTPALMTHPLNDKTAELFLKPSTEIVNALIKNNTVEESLRRSKAMFKEHITKLLHSEVSRENTTMIRYLWWDMKHQVALGKMDATVG